MRLEKWLNEDNSDELQTALQLIETECGPYLRALKKIDIDSDVVQDWFSDMGIKIHIHNLEN